MIRSKSRRLSGCLCIERPEISSKIVTIFFIFVLWHPFTQILILHFKFSSKWLPSFFFLYLNVWFPTVWKILKLKTKISNSLTCSYTLSYSSPFNVLCISLPFSLYTGLSLWYIYIPRSCPGFGSIIVCGDWVVA